MPFKIAKWKFQISNYCLYDFTWKKCFKSWSKRFYHIMLLLLGCYFPPNFIFGTVAKVFSKFYWACEKSFIWSFLRLTSNFRNAKWKEIIHLRKMENCKVKTSLVSRLNDFKNVKVMQFGKSKWMNQLTEAQHYVQKATRHITYNSIICVFAAFAVQWAGR